MSSKHTSIAIYNLYIQSIQVLYTNVHTYITLRCIAIQLPLQLQSQYIHHHTSVYIQYIGYIVSEFKMKKTWHRGSYDPSRTPAHSTSVRPSKILTVSVTSRIKKDLGSQSTTAKPSKTMRTGWTMLNLNLHESPWISMNLHESPWISMNLHESPWISMNLHESPWISMNLHESPWISMNLHESPWISMNLM